MSEATDASDQEQSQEYDWEDVKRIDGNLTGLFNQISQLKDEVQDLREENERLREDLEAAESVAETALGVARAVEDDGGDTPKVDVARLKTRNYLLREAAKNCIQRDSVTGKKHRNIDASVTTSKVKEMAKPEVSLNWQSIVDSWGKLEESWDCFEEGTNRNGDRALKLVDEPPEPMVRAVERDLDDLADGELTKRLVGDLDGEAGSEGGI